MHNRKMTKKKSRGMRRGQKVFSGFLERKPAKNLKPARKRALPRLIKF